MAVAGEQAHAISLALNDQAVAVELDFVDPLGAVRNFRHLGRDAGLDGAKIVDGVKNANRMSATTIET